MGESMRKIFMLVMPLFVLVFFACGCTTANSFDAPKSLLFDCDTELFNLRIGTAEEENEIAFAPLLTSGTLEDCLIEYDKNIIDYNPVTGKMVALNTGTTKIRATAGDKTVSVEVVVDKAVYCSSLETETVFVELGKPATLTPKTNSGYNMGFEFYNLSPGIISIDEKGVIEPICTGIAQVKVVAKGALNKQNASGYEAVYCIIDIQVIEPRTTLELAILDENMQELEYTRDDYGMKNYTLFSSDDNKPLYFLKIYSDKSLVNCYFSDITTSAECTNLVEGSQNTRLYKDSQDYRYFQDGAIYLSFYALDCGRDYMAQEIVEQGLNFYYQRVTERICINVFRLNTENNFGVRLYEDEEMTTQYTSLNSDGLYYLYDDTEVFAKVIFDKYALNKYSYEAQNLNVTTTNDGTLKITRGDVAGVGYLTIKSADASEVEIVLGFCNMSNETTISTDSTPVVVLYTNGDEPATFETGYTVYSELGELVYSQNCEIVFLDDEGAEINLADGVLGYTDVTYPSLVIEFNEVGKYKFRLRSTTYGYLSSVITVYVFNETSLVG